MATLSMVWSSPALLFRFMVMTDISMSLYGFCVVFVGIGVVVSYESVAVTTLQVYGGWVRAGVGVGEGDVDGLLF